jgi:hypothetical protein
MRAPLLLIATLAATHTMAASTVADGAAAHFKFSYGKVGFHAVKADLSTDQLSATTQVAPKLKSVWSFISDARPVAALTGTFFAFESQQPVADVIVNGAQVATGYRGSVLGIDWFGRPRILNAITREPFDYLEYRYAVRGGVRVLEKGKVSPNPKAQGFKDPRIWGSAPRTAVGLTGNGKLLLVATRQSITLSTLGNALKSQGAVDALSFDGGGSTMLYFNGDLLISPQRPLVNVIMIEKRSPLDSLFRKKREADMAQKSGQPLR